MAFAYIFDAIVVNYQAKYNKTPSMVPEARGIDVVPDEFI